MSRIKKDPLARRTYRISELAEILGLSRATIYRMIDSGALRVITIPGGLRLIDAKSVEDVLSGKIPTRKRKPVGQKKPEE